MDRGDGVMAKEPTPGPDMDLQVVVADHAPGPDAAEDLTLVDDASAIGDQQLHQIEAAPADPDRTPALAHSPREWLDNDSSG
jgi:hypothetical protein